MLSVLKLLLLLWIAGERFSRPRCKVDLLRRVFSVNRISGYCTVHIYLLQVRHVDTDILRCVFISTMPLFVCDKVHYNQ